MSDKTKINPNSRWVVSTESNDSSTKPKANDLVLAWAVDKDNDQPKYILELDESHRGAKCNCICVGCKLPLTAVNVAKIKYQQRPHFKHPKGAERDNCLVLAARYAIAQQLFEQGLIELPQRKVSSRIVGLSGRIYEAWEYTKPEQVKITDTQFEDKATALLSLDDGRQILVQLTGSLSELVDNENSLIPIISLDVGNDLSLAGMSPIELRKRLTILWAGACWHSHWADAELLEKASNEAKIKATSELDWLVDDGSIEGVETFSHEQKRESLLHLEVKNILAREKRINLPELVVSVEREAPRHGGYFREKHWPSELVTLQDVYLEKRLGRVIPDVIATVNDSQNLSQAYTLLIEVTVTNTISEERLQRIKSTNLPTLEIDVGRMGGCVTRDELVALVVEELAAKSWLHHPMAVSESVRLEADIDAEIQRLIDREASRAKSLETPLELLAKHFISNFTKHSNLREQSQILLNRKAIKSELEAQQVLERFALEQLQDSIYALELNGYPEIRDSINFNLARILERLLSIRTDTVVGYALNTCWQVINTINMDRESSCKWHTLFLIAITQYRPSLTHAQTDKVLNWRTKVIASIKEGSSTYLRSTKYDALLSLLFPEMRGAINNGFGASPVNKKTLATQKKSSSPKPTTQNYTDTRKEDLWLKGRDLEKWKLRFPEAAKFWFGSQSKLDIKN